MAVYNTNTITITDALIISHTIIKRDVFFGNISKPVSFDNNTIKGDVFLWNKNINAPVSFSNTTIKGGVFFGNSNINAPVFFRNTTIEGGLFFRNPNIKALVSFHHNTIEGGLFFRNPNIKDSVSFHHNTIKGGLFFRNPNINACVYFHHNTIEGGVFLRNPNINASVLFHRNTIDGHISFRNPNINATVFFCNTTIIEGCILFKKTNAISVPVNFRNLIFRNRIMHTLADPRPLSFYIEGEENKQPDEKSNGQGKLNQGDGHTLANPLSLSFYTEGEENKQPDEKSNGQGKLNQGDGRTIGKVFVSNIEIAKGSNGTIVLEGTYEVVRPVAVKRLVKGHHDVADKEYQNLCVSDRHSNIVRLYGVEEDQYFVYLALERCTGSLNDLIQMQLLDAPTTSGDQATEVNIEYKVRLQSMKGTLPEVKLWEDNGYPSPTLWKLMRDMVSGLVHLHELGMLHRDLKPQNVLIVKEGSLCAKLADMGISKSLVVDKSSLGNHATGCGTSGWQAPELLCHGRQTRAIDVFSLGCVLFYCISGGKHPFGDPLVRDVNIKNGKVKLFLVKHIPEAMDLLDHLLDPKAELRPKASEVLIHLTFWDSDKRLSFLRDASDRVQQEGFGSAILKELERIAPRVLGTKPGKNMVLLNWDEKIDPSLLNDINNPRKYYYDRVRDLLRFIRNKKNHFFELPHEIQDILGPVPEGFDGYFRSRFPKLLMEVYKVLHKYCTEEECFKRYFKGSAV